MLLHNNTVITLTLVMALVPPANAVCWNALESSWALACTDEQTACKSVTKMHSIFWYIILHYFMSMTSGIPSMTRRLQMHWSMMPSVLEPARRQNRPFWSHLSPEPSVLEPAWRQNRPFWNHLSPEPSLDHVSK